MLNEDYRTIKELIDRYELEPDLKDVYVEGRRDYIFFKNFFEQIHNKNVVVYQISDTIKFSEDLKNKAKKQGFNLSKNNRNKVIFLAYEIDSQLTNKNPIICITDSDFDIILNINHNCSIIFFTDYANLEMYLFNIETIKKYLENFLRKINCPINKILYEFGKFLNRLFLIRLINEILNLNLEWLDFSKYWSCRKLEINFYEEKFIESYLSKNNKLHNKAVFILKIKEMERRLTNEPRNQINGHDFINLLRIFNKRGLKKRQKFCDKDIVEGVLYSSLEISYILKENLFKKLLKWVQN